MKTLSKWRIVASVSMLIVTFTLFAQTSVLPVGSGSGDSLIQSNAPSGLPGKITVRASCYGTNNRSTSNPLSDEGIIYLYISAEELDKVFIIKFPGMLTKSYSGGSNSESCGIYSGKLSEVNVESPSPADYSYPPADCSTGNIIADAVGFVLNRTRRDRDGASGVSLTAFSYQTFAGGARAARSYYGSTGKMGGGTKHTNLTYSEGQASNGAYSVEISLDVTYPGQDGFCGGYHSPLMFFFSSARPAFTGSSKLMRAKRGGGMTFWVEKNHQGYFLAKLDSKNRSKGIYRANQLFGDEKYFQNGFSALSMHDSNGDYQIDKRDKVWKDLVLWKDKDSNSRSSKGELHSLSSLGVTKIDLRYNHNFQRSYADRATAIGKSSFDYRRGKSTSKGVVIDIFFREHQ